MDKRFNSRSLFSKYLLTLYLTLGFVSQVQASELTINITGIKKIQGKLHLVVYDSKDAMKKKKAYKSAVIPVENKSHTTHFKEMVPGTYAVMLYQDLDGDGELKTNWIGIPKEPAGLSNNPKLMGPPTFKKLAFKVGETSKEIQIELK